MQRAAEGVQQKERYSDMFPAPHLLSQAPSAPLHGDSSFILTPPADLHLLPPHVL